MHLFGAKMPDARGYRSVHFRLTLGKKQKMNRREIGRVSGGGKEERRRMRRRRMTMRGTRGRRLRTRTVMRLRKTVIVVVKRAFVDKKRKVVRKKVEKTHSNTKDELQ